MIILETPIAIKEIHHLILGWIRFFFVKKSSLPQKENAKLNFLYFSYEPDYEFILLSLKSLKNNIDSKYLGNVFLIVDQKAPFNETQIQTFQDLFPSIIIHPVYNFEWGSAQSTLEELEIFKKMTEYLQSDWDFLIKVDSDILFFNDKKLIKALNSTIQAFGDGHYLQFQYAQGGLYMIRKQLILSAFKHFNLNKVKEVVNEINSVGEDKAISHILKTHKKPFFFSRLMLFPEEYGRLSKISSWVLNEFVALHCHKDKHNMRNLIEKFNISVK